MSDLQFTNHGSIVLLAALTEAGQEWVSEHLPDDAMTFGNAIVIEPRYVAAIAEGAVAAGLVTSPSFGHFNETFDSRTWR